MKIRALNRDVIMNVANMESVLKTVEDVYVSKASENAIAWPTVFYDFKTGEKDMDIRSGYLKDAGLHGLKVINWTLDNPERGIPALIGVILLFDTDTGLPIGILDGGLITGMRTGCAGAVGAKYLARKDSDTLFVLGAGNQAFYQVAAFVTAFPGLRKVYISDPVSPQNAAAFVEKINDRLMTELRIDASHIEFMRACSESDMAIAVGDSDMVVTVTPARIPVIRKEWVKPGTHFSCIGADMSGKEEIDEDIFKYAKIFCDDIPHCIEAGEMEIPLLHSVISESDIQGEIGSVISGKLQGRTSEDDITIYDACGMALLDIATAKAILELAEEKKLGAVVDI